MSTRATPCHADEAFEIARSIGWQPGQAFAAIVRFNALAAQGEYRRISSSSDDLGLADELEHRQWITAAQHALGCLHLDLLDLTTAQRHFERGLALAREMGPGVWVGTLTSGLASALAEHDEGQRAEVLLDELAASRHFRRGRQPPRPCCARGARSRSCATCPSWR